MQRTDSKAIEKMDVKKTHSSASAKNWDGKKIVNFAGEVKQELKKVEWTSKQELKSYTKIVLVSTFVFGFLVYFADLIIDSSLNFVHYLVRIIFG